MTASGTSPSSTPPPTEPGGRDLVPAPDDATLAALLDAHAPLTEAPLCPELRVFHARSLVEIWEAAEQVAGRPVPSPFWAYPWPGGAALARTLLDRPEWVRGRSVLDFGAGGGIASLAAAAAGAARVVANDVDPWALATTRLAAARQGLAVATSLTDLTADADPARDELAAFDVVLCGDLAYERAHAPGQRAVLERARRGGALVLVADAGRTYFDDRGLEPVASFVVRVPLDLEGVEERVARVFRL